jgi:hypothetical protein
MHAFLLPMAPAAMTRLMKTNKLGVGDSHARDVAVQHGIVSKDGLTAVWRHGDTQGASEERDYMRSILL